MGKALVPAAHLCEAAETREGKRGAKEEFGF